MTMTRQPNLTRPLRADAQRNYERIVEEARVAFAAHGPDASLDEIARRAGVGPGTLYRHFPNRLALQDAVLRDGHEALRLLADELLQLPSPGEALTIWLRARLAHAVTGRALGAAVDIAMLRGGSARSAGCAAVNEAAAALLRRAQEAAAVRRDVDGTALLRLVDGIALATERAPNSAAEADRLLRVVIDGLRADPDRDGRAASAITNW